MILRLNLLFAFCFSGYVFSQPTTHTAHLMGSSVVPANASSNFGSVLVSYNPSLKELTYTIHHTIENASAVRLHGPANTSSDGSLLFDLDASANPSAGSVTLTEELETHLFDGLIYVEISSAAFPEGEIRGQLNGHRKLTASLDGDQVVPAVDTQAEGGSVLFYNFAEHKLTIILWHSFFNPDSVTLNGPAAPGTNGNVQFELDSFPFFTYDEVNLTAGQEEALFNGLLYLSVNTDTHPGGEIRGQIQSFLTFVSYMSGLAQSPPVDTNAGGAASFHYLPLTRSLDYFVYHHVSDPISVNIHQLPNEGQNGEVVFELGSDHALSGNLTLTEAQETALYNSELYLNVSSAAHPDGEIRGPISTVAESVSTWAHYYELVIAWGENEVHECFGEEVHVTDIIAFIENDYVCPEP